MTKDQWQNIATIVDNVLEIPPADRDSYIKRECGDNPKLVEQVLDFMKSIASSEGLWDNLLRSNQILVNDLTASGELVTFKESVSHPEQIGSYKIIRCLAAGGMGNVFLAERNDGQFSRKVAIKILKRELSAKYHIDRFIAEREILSGLEHPNIARLYDGGVTDDGRPYLLMEYVDGLPIHQYFSQNSCNFSVKLDLFAQICKAVKYAHTNLIIHRDLKPDNIFVNNSGNIKILDFGIAKIVDQDLTESSVTQTREGTRMLSLQYASPEQITLDKVTTAADVYALGLILYEILTGNQPYQLIGKKINKAEHIIRFHQPETPSQAVANPAESRRLKGDLDAIILKSLRKEPEERYESAGQMLEDIERYQQKIPVFARKGTFRYRAAKYIKRNQGVLSLAAIFLIAAISFTAYHFQKLTEERNIAKIETEKARAVTGFLTGIFENASPYNQPNSEITALEILDHGTEYIQNEIQDQPEIKSSMLSTVGGIYQVLGSYDKAENLLNEALELEKGNKSMEHGDDYGLAVVHNNLGNLKTSQGDYQTAIEHLKVAAVTFDKLNLQDYRAGSLSTWGWNEYLIANYPRADSLIQIALSIYQTQNGIDSPKTANTLQNLAWVKHDMGNHHEADSIFADILDKRRNHYKGDHPEIATTMHSLGWLKYQIGEYEEGISLYEEAITMRRRLFNNESHPDIAWSVNNMGIIKQAQGKYDEAEELFREALQMRRKILPKNHQHISQSLGNLGSIYFYREDYDQSITIFREVVEIQRNLLGNDHPNLAMYLNNLATVLSMSNHSRQAIPYYLEALKIQENHFDKTHPTTVQMRSNLADAYENLNGFENAENYRLENFEALKQEKGIEHTQTQIELINLITLYRKWNDLQKTVQYEALIVDYSQ